MPTTTPLEQLVAQLQLAYSGELAAGFAYRGHWRSVTRVEERERIRAIEAEEWHHRRLLGDMLARLGARPRRTRELRAWLIGRTLGLLCHVAGWFLPMYGAGRLERRNVAEYEVAAAYARASGHPELVDCLLGMAEVEWDHESWFRGRVAGHPATRWLRLWAELPPRATIRAGGREPGAPIVAVQPIAARHAAAGRQDEASPEAPGRCSDPTGS